jgi:toxin FitB
LVLGEIRRHRKAATAMLLKPVRVEKWLSTIKESYGERILPVHQMVADEWGSMSAIRPLPSVDALLAATAKIHGMTLATRNVADVAGLGADVMNPFEPSASRR